MDGVDVGLQRLLSRRCKEVPGCCVAVELVERASCLPDALSAVDVFGEGCRMEANVWCGGCKISPAVSA